MLALAVALAVGAVLHGDEAGLDQRAVGRLDLRCRKAERLLLHGGRGPDDRPPSPAPVLRLGEFEQPVDGMHQAGRQPQPGCGRLQGGQHLPWHGDAFRQPVKGLRGAIDLQQARRQSAKAGRGTGIASPLRPKGAFRLHYDPPSGWIVTGKPHPLSENGNFHLQMERLGTRLEVFECPRPQPQGPSRVSQKPARQGGLLHF